MDNYLKRCLECSIPFSGGTRLILSEFVDDEGGFALVDLHQICQKQSCIDASLNEIKRAKLRSIEEVRGDGNRDLYPCEVCGKSERLGFSIELEDFLLDTIQHAVSFSPCCYETECVNVLLQRLDSAVINSVEGYPESESTGQACMICESNLDSDSVELQLRPSSYGFASKVAASVILFDNCCGDVDCCKSVLSALVGIGTDGVNFDSEAGVMREPNFIEFSCAFCGRDVFGCSIQSFGVEFSQGFSVGSVVFETSNCCDGLDCLRSAYSAALERPVKRILID